MVDKTLLTVLPFLWLSGVSAGLVTKCKSDDTKCLKESTQALIPEFAKGLPEYNVKPMDPMKFKKIDASTSNLKLIVTDVIVTGSKDCVAKKVVRDKSKNTLMVTLNCNIKIEGQYEMDGQLLIIPIKGKGPLHVTLRQLELTVEAILGTIEKQGVAYWDVKEWKPYFALKDKSDVVFENLFDGNEVLAQAARDVVTSGSNEVIMEVGPPAIKTIVTEIVKNVNKFFHSIPAQELSLD